MGGVGGGGARWKEWWLRHRDTERQRQRHKQRDRDTERETQRERHLRERQRERQREREKWPGRGVGCGVVRRVRHISMTQDHSPYKWKWDFIEKLLNGLQCAVGFPVEGPEA